MLHKKTSLILSNSRLFTVDYNDNKYALEGFGVFRNLKTKNNDDSTDFVFANGGPKQVAENYGGQL